MVHVDSTANVGLIVSPFYGLQRDQQKWALSTESGLRPNNNFVASLKNKYIKWKITKCDLGELMKICAYVNLLKKLSNKDLNGGLPSSK